MSKSTRCSQSRKISEDNVGQKIYKKQIKRIHHKASRKWIPAFAGMTPMR